MNGRKWLSAHVLPAHKQEREGNIICTASIPFQSAPKQPQGHRYGDGEGIAPDAAHSEEGRGSTGTACQLVEAEDEVCSRMRMHPVAMAGTALQQQQQEVGMDGPDGACSKMSDMALGSGQGEGPTKAGRAGGQLVALPTQPHTAAQGNTKQQQQQQQQLEGRPVKEHVAAFEEAMQAARQQRLASTPLKQQQQQQQQLGNMSPWRGAPPQQQHKQQAQLLPPDSLEGALASLELAAQHVECQIAAAGDASRGGLQQHHKAVLVRVVGQLGGLLQDKHSSSSSSGGADHGELDVVPASGRMQVCVRVCVSAQLCGKLVPWKLFPRDQADEDVSIGRVQGERPAGEGRETV
eukprot:1158199-Pelagomonas_calceolata.AAC.13